MCFFYMPYHFTTPQTSTNHKKAEMDNLIGTKFRCSHQNMIHRLRHNDKSLFAETGARRPLNFSPPKEETNGEEVSQMHRLKPIVVHATKEWISEAVVGIVVFASVSSRSLDKDPSWTPCGRSSYGTCWMWPMHLSKLHAPRKRWKI